MNIKDLSKKSLDFTIKRVAEIIGILLICLSTLFLLSLISYSPEDPNFIFSENTIINNILGFKGSYVSDLFFQSVGLISFLIAFTIFFTGINLIKYKNFLVIIENIFYSILYIILGSLFFSIFYVVLVQHLFKHYQTIIIFIHFLNRYLLCSGRLVLLWAF
mgnify:CR=1 FL=1